MNETLFKELSGNSPVFRQGMIALLFRHSFGFVYIFLPFPRIYDGLYKIGTGPK